MGRRSFARRDFIIGFFGFLIGLFALVLWLMPRVVRQDFEDLAVSAVGPLSVTFNQPITLDSLPANFFIAPHVTGTLDVSGRQLIFQPNQPWEYDQSYTVSLRPGIRGSNGLPGLVGSTLTFSVEEPRLLFLREIDGRSNIWRQEEAGPPFQLTDEPVGVWDFQATPDGQGILYSALEADSSSDLILRANDGSRVVLLDCPAERCIFGHWQPGGPLIAFERKPLTTSAGKPGEVWLLDPTDGALEPAANSNLLAEFGLQDQDSNSPRWSADGRYLALYLPNARLVLIKDLVSQSSTLVPANLEIMGDWSPVSAQLAYSELAIGQPNPDDSLVPTEANSSELIPALYNHITMVDVAGEAATDLSAGQVMDYGKPVWHPDGKTLAAPAGARGGAWQIWTLGLSGEEPQVYTNNPSLNHSSLAWSPDGRLLAFMGNDRGSSESGPAVWLLDSETGDSELIVAGAYLPAWQP